MPNDTNLTASGLETQITNTVQLLEKNDNERIKEITNKIQIILDKLNTEKWKNEETIKKAYYLLLNSILNSICGGKSCFENNKTSEKLGTLLVSFLMMAPQLLEPTTENPRESIIPLLEQNNLEFLKTIRGSYYDPLIYYVLPTYFVAMGIGSFAFITILPSTSMCIPIFFIGIAALTIITCAAYELSLHLRNPTYSAAKAESQFIKDAPSLFANPENKHNKTHDKDATNEDSPLLTA